MNTNFLPPPRRPQRFFSTFRAPPILVFFLATHDSIPQVVSPEAYFLPLFLLHFIHKKTPAPYHESH